MDKPSLTFGSLFAGIGGFDLGFERAGMTCKWQVEIDPYANRVLAKHWPNVRRHGDVCTFPPKPAADWSVDVICGGFPCQDISNAGKRAGIEGERSGLWSEFARIIRVLRPRFVVVENVAALLGRGLGRVLGDLAACGYDAEWDCIPASAVGAPHRRDRLWIVGYARGTAGEWNSRRLSSAETRVGGARQHDGDLSQRSEHAGASSGAGNVANTISEQDHAIGRDRKRGRDALGRRRKATLEEVGQADPDRADGCGEDVANAPRVFQRRQEQRAIGERTREGGEQFALCNANEPGLEVGQSEPSNARQEQPAIERADWWLTEPNVGRVAHGIPFGLEFLGGRLDVDQSGDTEADAAGEPLGWQVLRVLWEQRQLAATSPYILGERLRDIVPALPCNGGLARWVATAETDEELRDLWERFYAVPFQEARDMQQALLERARTAEREQTVAFKRQRVNRLRGLGNAIVPQIAEWIGKRLVEVAA